MRKDDSENRGPAARASGDATEARGPAGVRAGAASADEETADRIIHDTTTRERQARAKRAHEPLDMDLADAEQPVEDDNGPRLAEVNGAEAAKVEDPSQPTQSEGGPEGKTAKPSA